MSETERKAIPKSIRFDVLKRDLFKCQYCGAPAPEVMLHVDHIEAVARGGTNDLTNLITACEGCNLGKSDKPLGENATVEKSRAQMEELQARREQLEMMMEWRKGLRDLDSVRIDDLASYWKSYTKGWELNSVGKTMLAKLASKYTTEEICTAMDAAARTYLKIGPDGRPDMESVVLATDRIGGICRTNKKAETDPDIKELYYIRGILRKRIPGYFNEPMALDLLRAARSWDVSTDELREIAVRARNWSGFRSAVVAAIDERKHDDD